jgi:Spy/CpxP family protein refolding chaperone
MEVKKMKKPIIAVGLVMAMFFFTGHALAQGSGHESGHGSTHQRGVSQAGSHQHGQEAAVPGKDFSFTPEQKEKLRDLRRKFELENAQLIGALVAKRIELHALWSDPKADPKAIMEKEKEQASIRFQLREKMVQSKLEARKFLTSEQMTHFGRHWGMGFKKRMGHGEMAGHHEMMHHGGRMGHRDKMGHREATGQGGMMCCGRMGSDHGKGHGAEHGSGGMEHGRGMGHGSWHGMGGMGMCK